ncbi:hypothetical protein PIROE2DRAFT_59397 [Piromyces sp. E2]|nr:hypothetical protein PIROE2DRAFT_59397 [Piromyces sp. E2]|eukprot:OUM66358.1 hypothetical protein PIROE2DRAFT_59397 [Piromyces sp. E2]
MLSVPPAYRNHEIQWAITACFFLLDYLYKSLNVGEGILPWMQQAFHTIYHSNGVSSSSSSSSSSMETKQKQNNHEFSNINESSFSKNNDYVKSDIKVKNIVEQLYQKFKDDESDIDTPEKLEILIKRINQWMINSINNPSTNNDNDINNNINNDDELMFTPSHDSISQRQKILIERSTPPLPLPIITCHCQLDPITGYTKLFSQRQYIMTSESEKYHQIMENGKSHYPLNQNLAINTSVRCLSGEEIQLGLNTIPHGSSKTPIHLPHSCEIPKITCRNTKLINNNNNNNNNNNSNDDNDDDLPIPPNSGTIDNEKGKRNERTLKKQLSPIKHSVPPPMNYNELYQIYLNCRKDKIKDHLSYSQLLNSYSNDHNTNKPPNKININHTTEDYPNFNEPYSSPELPAEVLKRIFMFLSQTSEDFSPLMLVCRKWYQLGTLCRWKTLNLNISKPWDAFYFFLTSQQFPETLLKPVNHHKNHGYIYKGTHLY